jgi:hypothetical protein
MDPTRRRPPPPRINLEPQYLASDHNGRAVHPESQDAHVADLADSNLLEQRCKSCLLLRYRSRASAYMGC